MSILQPEAHRKQDERSDLGKRYKKYVSLPKPLRIESFMLTSLSSPILITAFYNSLHCLSKFSDTFWLQCTPRPSPTSAQVRLSTINATNSAFCLFAFDPDFFLSLTTPAPHQKVECQIALKPILTILRTRGRSVERLELSLSPPTSSSHRFNVTLHCAHGIKKSHSFTFSPKRGLMPTADPNPPHFFSLNASTAAEWTDHFLSSSRNGEITFVCTPTSFIARSKDDELPPHVGSSGGGGGAGSSGLAVRKAIHTEVKLALDEFKEYGVLEDVGLTFSLKEFKACVALAEAWGCVLEVNFGKGEEPVFVRMRVEGAVVAEVVIATTRAGPPGEGPPPLPQPQHQHQQHHHQQQQQAQHTQPRTIPNHSTPFSQAPERERDDGPTLHLDSPAQPLFFPGPSQSQPSQSEPEPSQLEPEPEPEPEMEMTFVNPTPVSRGGDPDDFLTTLPASQPSPSHSHTEDTDTEPETGSARKRFKPLF